MSLTEGSQGHACQDTDDDAGEVQNGKVGAAEEDEVYEYEAEAGAGDAGNEEGDPG